MRTSPLFFRYKERTFSLGAYTCRLLLGEVAASVKFTAMDRLSVRDVVFDAMDRLPVSYLSI